MIVNSFFNGYKLYEVPNRFSYQHVLLLLLTGICIFLIIYFLRKASHKTQRIFLIVIISVCMVIYAGRMFFGWEDSRIYNDGSKTTLLPLELCNINILVAFAALLLNKKFLNNYMYYVTLLGGLIPLIVFPDCHMITNGNNLFHYMFLDFWFIHSSLVMVSLAMICWKWYRPNARSIPLVILLVASIYLFDFLVCIILRNFEPFKGANYMYVMYHNNLPILKQLYTLIPIPFLYGLPIAVPLAGVFYLMSLPFKRKGEKG